MYGGTSLFSPQAVGSIRGWMAALLIVALAALLLIETIGERRGSPATAIATVQTGATLVESAQPPIAFIVVRF